MQRTYSYTVGKPPLVTFLPETVVHAIQWDNDRDRFAVHLTGRHPAVQPFDRIVSHTGFRPDLSIHGELQVHESQGTAGPKTFVGGLSDQTSGVGPGQPGTAADTLRLSEPNFYILGSKSHGGNAGFLFATGLDQIRQLFTIIGDRADLDLYANMQRLMGEA